MNCRGLAKRRKTKKAPTVSWREEKLITMDKRVNGVSDLQDQRHGKLRQGDPQI